MKKSITGVFEYDGKNYPFLFDNNIVKLTGTPFQFLKPINNEEEVATIHGVTSDNRDILFLNCKLNKRLPCSNIAFSMNGYLLSANNVGIPCHFNFDKITFYSDAINTFYSPQNAIEIKNDCFDNWDGSIEINIKPFCDTDVKFDFNSDQCQINIDRYICERYDISKIGSVNSSFSFICNNRSNPENVEKYYLALYDFLCFVNYSFNINFTKIELKIKECNKYRTIAYAHIFSNHSIYENSEDNSITTKEIPIEKIEKVFSKVVNLRYNSYRYHFYFPENKSETNTVDPGKWLIMALNFEGLFNDTFKNFKAKGNQNFAKAKELILKQINSYDTCCLSSKEKKYYVRCAEQIVRYEGVLEEKFNYTYKKFKDILSEIVKSNKLYYPSIKEKDYADVYTKYRNKIAHGNIEPLTEKEIAIYRLLRPMIYAMILDGSLSESEIKAIINKLFK